MDLEHERRLTVVEDRSQSNTKRLDAMEQRQDDLEDLVVSVKLLATKQTSLESDVKEIKKDVKELTNKPIKRFEKRWDKVVEAVLIAIAGAFVGILLAKIGL